MPNARTAHKPSGFRQFRAWTSLSYDAEIAICNVLWTGRRPFCDLLAPFVPLICRVCEKPAILQNARPLNVRQEVGRPVRRLQLISSARPRSFDPNFIRRTGGPSPLLAGPCRKPPLRTERPIVTALRSTPPIPSGFEGCRAAGGFPFLSHHPRARLKGCRWRKIEVPVQNP